MFLLQSPHCAVTFVCLIAVSVMFVSFCVSYYGLCATVLLSFRVSYCSFCDVEVPVCVLLQSPHCSVPFVCVIAVSVLLRSFYVFYCSLCAVEVLSCVLLQFL